MFKKCHFLNNKDQNQLYICKVWLVLGLLREMDTPSRDKTLDMEILASLSTGLLLKASYSFESFHFQKV